MSDNPKVLSQHSWEALRREHDEDCDRNHDYFRPAGPCGWPYVVCSRDMTIAALGKALRAMKISADMWRLLYHDKATIDDALDARDKVDEALSVVPDDWFH